MDIVYLIALFALIAVTCGFSYACSKLGGAK